MKLYEEVHRFSREYINNKSLRSSWRKRKIREAYEKLTGEKIKVSCNTCYIEALLTIVNNTKMGSQNFDLKRGVVLQAFGQPKKTCTNDTITDELGEWYLTHYPEKIVLFSRVPAKFRSTPPKDIIIIVPEKVKPAEVIASDVKVEEEITDEKPPDIAGAALKSAMAGVDSAVTEAKKTTTKKKTVRKPSKPKS